MLLWLIRSRHALTQAKDMLSAIDSTDNVIVCEEAVYDFEILANAISADFKVLDTDSLLRGLSIDNKFVVQENDVFELILKSTHTIKV